MAGCIAGTLWSDLSRMHTYLLPAISNPRGSRRPLSRLGPIKGDEKGEARPCVSGVPENHDSPGVGLGI